MSDFKSKGLSFKEEISERLLDKGEEEPFVVARELIKQVFIGMAKMSTKYCNDTYNMCDLPYLYSERRLDSVFLPVLSKLCDSMVLTELPVRRRAIRKRGQVNEKRGLIDYWCIYKNYSFIIELKQSFDCFQTNKTRKRKVIDPWDTMIDQVRSVTKYAKNCEERTKGVIRIGLHIITSYSDEEPTLQLIREFRENISNTIDRFNRKISKNRSRKPDMILCWKIPDILIFQQDVTYPGLWALAKIYPPVRHRGSI